MVDGTRETRGGVDAWRPNGAHAMEFAGKQMRDWQRSLAGDAAETVAAVPSAKTANVPPQIVWSLAVFVLVFAILGVLRPPFVESSQREKPLEPRRIQWGIVFVAASAAGGLVLLGSSVPQ